ncbi:hypothetical protein Q5H93_11460 [Hymenobacter sp. ASUV-10]|uniref:Uncharacterized protein n=1 Tax=Hymenobacter aranciens TaxID=3063996 RepID=A0ABT9BCH6_9BACT|nr:hypothetical protein [Hymenobacter sp. ASUV-10]MDO7875348.1 hypothetical protein [Hymenobacter sp. ASUV-10]
MTEEVIEAGKRLGKAKEDLKKMEKSLSSGAILHGNPLQQAQQRRNVLEPFEQEIADAQKQYDSALSEQNRKRKHAAEL